MRLGWFRPVHCKSLPAQEVRAVLTARKLLHLKRRPLTQAAAYGDLAAMQLGRVPRRGVTAAL
jgi:hypothetical protein